MIVILNSGACVKLPQALINGYEQVGGREGRGGEGGGEGVKEYIFNGVP